MPLSYIRRLTGRNRTQSANLRLAQYLAFVAGAVNAGGFLAIRQYSSHLTGIVSAMADNAAVGDWHLVLNGLAAVAAFVTGATCTASLVLWARRHLLESEYALPLLFEALLLGVFGLTGRVFEGKTVVGTAVLLGFTMGLQNAIVTKMSGAVIRTTHLTGMMTDVGINLGRILNAISSGEFSMTQTEVSKLRLLVSLIALFFTGGVVGALGFKHVGFLFTLPLAGILLGMASVPITDDLREHYGHA